MIGVVTFLTGTLSYSKFTLTYPIIFQVKRTSSKLIIDKGIDLETFKKSENFAKTDSIPFCLTDDTSRFI